VIKLKNKGLWIFIIVFLVILFLISSMIAGVVSLFMGNNGPDISLGNVALIPIKGVIMAEGGSTFQDDIASATEIIKDIEKANNAKNIKAIIFEINSPGGTAVASDEIAAAIKKVDKPTISYIREIGTSGAYWIASSTDHIFANRMSITGSIAVIGSYLEFSGLLARYNITYQRLVSSKYKDMGSPLKKLSPVEEALLQKQINKIHEYFVEEVANNRNLSKKSINKIATGEFFLGLEAKELGLIDAIGGKDEAISYIEENLNITASISEFKRDKSFLDLLSGVMNEKSFYVGKGIGNSLLDTKTTNRIEILT